MKKYLMFLVTVCIAAFTVVSFSSCSKDDDGPATPDYSAIQKQLQGTWKGKYATLIIDGEPAEYSELIFAFAGDKVTVTNGKNTETYTYTLENNGEATYIKYDDHAVFFELSGNTFKLLNTNGSYLLFAHGTVLQKQ